MAINKKASEKVSKIDRIGHDRIRREISDHLKSAEAMNQKIL